jgi:SAM-dependent methyltransferase
VGPRDWGAPLYAAVLDAGRVGPGTSVLDLGCGPGLFARAAAERGAQVTGIDRDPVAVRLAAAEVPDGSFSVGEAASPPSGAFDVAAAVQLLMHTADPVAVLSAAGRAAAVVVATVWGRPEECDVTAFGEALAPWLGRRQPPASPVTEPDRLRAMAARAELTVERLDEVTCVFDYADDDELVGPLLASGLMRAAGNAARLAAVRAAVLERLRAFRGQNGGYRLHNTFRVLVARRG